VFNMDGQDLQDISLLSSGRNHANSEPLICQ
jgi:hypothetical protein